MITEIGAVKVRGGEVLGEFQTLVNPRTRSRRSSPCSPASPTRWSPTRRRSSRRSRRSSSSRPAACWSRTTRRSTSGSCATSPSAQGRAVAEVRGARHRPAGPPGAHPRRGAQLQAVLAGRGVQLHDHAEPPRARRRPGHRRRAARPDRAARRPRRAHPRGAADVHLAGQPGRSAASATSPSTSRTRLASTSSATTAHRVLYVGKCKDLRTRVRTYFTASETRRRMGEMVGLAASVTPIECATAARGRGPRAAADRRAQAALQPPVPVPGEGPLLKLTSSRSRGCRWCARCATTAPTTSARSARGAPPSRRWPRCTRRSGSASAPTGCPVQPARRACVLAEMGRCLAPCDGSADAATLRRRRAPAPRRLLRRPDDVVDGHQRRMAALAAASASRRPASTATGWRPSSGRPPACSGSAALTRSPSWSPHAARTTAAGRSTSSGTAGWPRPASSRRAPTPRNTSPSSGLGAETVLTVARARCPRRPPRRPSACCAGWSRPASAWSTSTASGPARSPGRPDTCASTTRAGESPEPGALRRPPTPGDGPPARPLTGNGLVQTSPPRAPLNYRRTMAQVSIGRRLPRDLSLGLFLAFSCGLLWHSVLMVDRWGIGWDAHAYYVAWSGDLYDVSPGHPTPTTTAHSSPRSSGR